MFGYLNRLQIKQCIVVHRKHMKRRIGRGEERRQFSSVNYSKLGDLYARLGLTADVSQDDIKKTYYQLSLEHHPDKNQGCSVSSEKFRSITEAYEILGNVATRAQYDRDTPYGKSRRRRPYYNNAESSSTFSEKDEELAEKIRDFRQNMRKKAKKKTADEYEEFMYRRENMFDFDAWYQAHFRGDYTEKIRNERTMKNAREYQEQMDRIARGVYRVRPPRPLPQHDEPPSDIEIQIAKMEAKEFRKDVTHFFMFIALFLVSFFIAAYIIEENIDKSPWVDPYVIKREKEKAEEEKKKSTKQL